MRRPRPRPETYVQRDESRRAYEVTITRGDGTPEAQGLVVVMFDNGEVELHSDPPVNLILRVT